MAQNLLCAECSKHNIAHMFLPFKTTIETKVSTDSPIALIERLAKDFFTCPECPFCRLVAGMIKAAPIALEPGDVCSLQRSTYAQAYEDIYSGRRDPALWFPASAWGEEYVDSILNSQNCGQASRSWVATMTWGNSRVPGSEAAEQRAVGVAELIGYIFPEGGGYANSNSGPQETAERIKEKHKFRLRAMPTSDTLEGRLLRARYIDSDRVDMDLLRSWVSLCEEDHDTSAASPSSLALDSDLTLHVIDVKNNCLIALPSGMQYATLSYVWGPPSTPQLCWTQESTARLLAIGGLDKFWNDVPTTITDAMVVCKKLRIKYLWVDALCIQQDDKVMKARTIAQMDSVYTSSFLTIVCASGKDSWSGIPGVGRTPRNFFKLVEDVQGVKLTNACLDYEEAKETFVWKLRGWTMQEEFLSSRLLVFSEHQAFFRCRHAAYSEDTVMECPSSEGVRLAFDDFNEIYHENTLYACERTFDDKASELNRRQLTYEKDVLDAYAGISRHLSGKCGWTFWYGLPLEALDAALAFKCGGWHNVRRSIFPSWSWADWKADSMFWIGGRYADNRGRFTCAINEVDWFRWVADDKLGHYEKIDNNQIRKYDTDTDEVMVACLLKHWPLIAERRNIWRRIEIFPGLKGECNEAPPTLSRSTALALAALRAAWKVPLSKRPPLLPPPSTLLQKELIALIAFQTSFAWLQVREILDVPHEPGHETMHYYSLRRPENYDGLYLHFGVPASWRPFLDPRGVEVIVISRTPQGRDTALELMAIYTDDRGVSTKLAASTSLRMEDHGWELYKPQWRTVYLV